MMIVTLTMMLKIIMKMMKDNVDYVYDEYAVSADVEKRWWSWW